MSHQTADKRRRVAQMKRLEGASVGGGRYRLLRLAAVGGAGGVFEAMQDGLSRRVAVKVMAVGDVPRRRRFEREVASLAATSHPNLVVLLDHGRLAPGFGYIVMEWAGGASLSRLVGVGGALPPLQALRVVRQVVAALGALHARRIVHRDVKPGNVIVGDPDAAYPAVKLVDLGAARPLDVESGEWPRAVVGTPGFMAPEQARGEAVSQRTDVWAAGALLRWLCSGGQRSRAAGMPAAVRNVIAIATREDPERRPASAAALGALIDAAEAGLSATMAATSENVVDPYAPTRSVHELRAALRTVRVELARQAAPTRRLEVSTAGRRGGSLGGWRR